MRFRHIVDDDLVQTRLVEGPVRRRPVEIGARHVAVVVEDASPAVLVADQETLQVSGDLQVREGQDNGEALARSDLGDRFPRHSEASVGGIRRPCAAAEQHFAERFAGIGRQTQRACQIPGNLDALPADHVPGQPFPSLFLRSGQTAPPYFAEPSAECAYGVAAGAFGADRGHARGVAARFFARMFDVGQGHHDENIAQTPDFSTTDGFSGGLRGECGLKNGLPALY